MASLASSSALLPQREKREEGGLTPQRNRREIFRIAISSFLSEGIRMFFGVEAHHREMIGKRSRLVSPAVKNQMVFSSDLQNSSLTPPEQVSFNVFRAPHPTLVSKHRLPSASVQVHIVIMPLHQDLILKSLTHLREDKCEKENRCLVAAAVIIKASV